MKKNEGRVDGLEKIVCAGDRSTVRKEGEGQTTDRRTDRQLLALACLGLGYGYPSMGVWMGLSRAGHHRPQGHRTQLPTETKLAMASADSSERWKAPIGDLGRSVRIRPQHHHSHPISISPTLPPLTNHHTRCPSPCSPLFPISSVSGCIG